MKDELEELTTDPSTRRAATDWLMKVISSKEPINLHLNGISRPETAMAADEEIAAPKWGGEFTAEDLCGAPSVPVVKAPSASDSITADDVCWVPEEMRLKQQPAAPPPAPAPKVLLMGQQPIREAQLEPKVQEPELRKSPAASLAELSIGRTSLATEPATNHQSMEDFVSMADISRDPAPYMVEPISASYSARFHQTALEESPITAADISRDWIIQPTDPVLGREKDGVVLPFSFKVLKSKESAEATAAQPEAQPAQPAVQVEETIEAEPAPPAETVAAAPTAESAPETKPIAGSAPQAEAAPASVEPVQEAAEAAETPAVITNAIESQAVGSGVSQPDLQEIEAALQTLETAAPAGAELEPEPMRMEAALEPENNKFQVPENVFAREGFWNKPPRAEGAAEIETIQRTPLFRDMEPQAPFPSLDKMGDEESGKRPEGWFSAWKTLLRLGSVLPWVAQSLPALDSGAWAEQGAPGGGGELRQDVAGLRLVQYEIRTTVQDHSLQLKRMEEQLGRVRESLESTDKQDLTEDVRSMAKLVRLVGIGLGSLLALLIVLVIVLLAHGH